MNTPNNHPAFSIKQILFIIMLMAVTISACSLSSLTSAVATVDADAAAATVNAAVVATIAAETTETAVSLTTTPAETTETAVSPTTTPVASFTPSPTNDSATATPAPTGQNESNGQAAADTTAPVFSTVDASDALVYYNGDSCGRTAVTIQATITDDVGVEQVWVNYRFMGDAGGGDWRQMNLTAVGNNRYEATIDAAQMVGNELQGEDGVMQYQVFAEDAAGNGNSMPQGHPYGVELVSCSVLGDPPQPSSLSFSSIIHVPTMGIFYGQCNNDPTLLNVQAGIDPLDQIASAQILYHYENALGVSPTYTVDMFQLGIGEYAGDIDTAVKAADTMGTEDGVLSYFVRAIDNNGGILDSSQIDVLLYHCVPLELPPAIQLPMIEYFDESMVVNPGDTVFIEWNVIDACKVFLDDVEVNSRGTHVYAIPNNQAALIYDHILTAWGSTCDSNTQVEASVTIQILNN